MDDWKTIEGFTEESTIPPTMFDDPSVPTSSFSDTTSMVYGPELSIPIFGYPGQFADGGGGGMQEPYGHPRRGGFETATHVNGSVNMVATMAGPLALDPSWQGLVEQLGF